MHQADMLGQIMLMVEIHRDLAVGEREKSRDKMRDADLTTMLTRCYPLEESQHN